ncbi:putative transcription initiation factor TFIID 111 kDa subunit [Colletotrichum siamense]|uniref:Transcription initiation factor TFIID 111 kDa subunit n=1 Tax=Colletotrichum siamense TaxID=690259 RepID=A0A9P5F1N5_COLSI|nr:putative transcription initiation factor TFIID 111 kDa subunit [Colletotrichum siamense]KAF4854918.1 putative transcription initiation factor TFIID 111 kDa subunit [Colletotrichum siamense]KAF4865378.1 putative transcription initiation factor TFIID 111 kDa subunit [Colletotrichum siamense]KAF5492437.1 putative transcription initiation factor TFIID 111 kDa subunit [Colletotrichum siamense]
MSDEPPKSPPSPDNGDPKSQKDLEAQDDEQISRTLSQLQQGGDLGFSLDEPFDQSGKADDAEDYEDISDDDLPEEEEGEANPATSLSTVPGLTDDGGTSNDTDDLFGDGPSSPMEIPGPPSPAPHVHDPDNADASQYRDINFDPEPGYEAANQDPDIPAPAETVEDLVKQAWPTWQKGVILKWNELLPPKKARWIEKKPTKKPKTLIFSKLTLDLAADQEKLFRIPGTAAATRKQKRIDDDTRGLVTCTQQESSDEAEAEEFNLEQDSDSEAVAGFTLQDIEMVCDDWAGRIEQAEHDFQKQRDQEAAAHAAEAASLKRAHDDAFDFDWEEFMDDEETKPPPLKKTRPPPPKGLPEIPRFTAPSFDSFEDVTKRSSKRVILDLNDPYLLLEEAESQRGPKRQRVEQKLTRMANGHLRPDLSQRFNMSNDDAYEALKENHQHKVRATLGNLQVEHSMPALKLAWPFYKVKLDIRRDGYHRPYFKFGKHERQVIRFSKLGFHKRKQMKGKAHEVFRTTKDLGITDNSTAVLFEYCERTPPVLSNFGMGNRVINYYRKKKVDDEEAPPKMEIGESHILLPEDRSPFAIFGEVEVGQTMPTLHNQMYRAPIFKHKPRSTDFLCVRSSTGVDGSNWYLHKIDHLYVVGQTFPSVEVPGPHSRKVTNASKNRIKMISYRMMRRNEHSLVNLSEVTKHIADSTDAQNRQKLKEFLVYAKVEKGLWGLRPGETLMDENGIRAMIRPEDVCLIDGMQLGMQMLEDAGFDPNNVNLEDDNDEPAEEDDDERTGKGGKKAAEKNEEKLADKMAPWKTSKAFIDACAGKAMLKLHGQGDPTGHGLGFSFIRTSMKGGYLETVQKGGSHTTAADAMAAHPDAMRKANNGHAYNVKEQEAMYKKGIREIWEKQKANLEDGTQKDDDLVVPPPADEDDRFYPQRAQTPAHVDEGMSQITGLTTSTSRNQRKRLKITREVLNEAGAVEQKTVIIEDPVIIDRYIKRKKELELEDFKYGFPSRFPPLDPISGLLFNLHAIPAYIYVPLASTKEDRPESLTTIIADWSSKEYPSVDAEHLIDVLAELIRSSNGSTETNNDESDESNKKDSTDQSPASTLAHPKQTERPRAQPASVPIVDRSATSKPTKSIALAVLQSHPRPTSDLRSLFRTGARRFKLKAKLLRKRRPRRAPQKPVLPRQSRERQSLEPKARSHKAKTPEVSKRQPKVPKPRRKTYKYNKYSHNPYWQNVKPRVI